MNKYAYNVLYYSKLHNGFKYLQAINPMHIIEKIYILFRERQGT